MYWKFLWMITDNHNVASLIKYSWSWTRLIKREYLGVLFNFQKVIKILLWCFKIHQHFMYICKRIDWSYNAWVAHCHYGQAKLVSLNCQFTYLSSSSTTTRIGGPTKLEQVKGWKVIETLILYLQLKVWALGKTLKGLW